MLHLGCLISRATGDSCVMLENTKTAEERLRLWLFEMQENAVWDMNHAEMQVTHTQMQELHKSLNSNALWLNSVLGALNAPLLTTRLEFNLYSFEHV